MQINNAGIRNMGMISNSEKVVKSESSNFADTLLDRINRNRDLYVASKQRVTYPSENYNYLVENPGQRNYMDSVKPIETERYTIQELDKGYLYIYDKERTEGISWELNEDKIQVDEETGTKFLINDFGSGFFMMMTVDAELEKGLKESLGVDHLEEKKLTGFTVHQDKKTGIKYVTANGYESRGGSLVLDAEGSEKLDSLAKVYLKKYYPDLVKTYNEAWFYASFEVRGLAKQLENGIMMISPNSISFKSKDGKNDWGYIFDPEKWKEVKGEFDRNGNSRMEEWKYWEQIFKKMSIDSRRITRDTDYKYDDQKIVDKAGLDYQKFRELCFNLI